MSTERVICKATGAAMNLTTEVIEDACSECSATGVIRYSTEEDYAQYNAEDDHDPDYDYIAETGRRICTHCDGTGKVVGEGPLIKWRMRLASGVRYAKTLFP